MALVILGYSIWSISAVRSRAVSSEAISILRSYNFAQDAYLKEYGEYAKEEKQLGFAVENKSYDLLVKTEDFNSQHRMFFPKSVHPFVEGQGYLVVLLRNGTLHEASEVWITDQSKKIWQLNLISEEGR